MVNAVNSLRHENCLLLVCHGLSMLPHDVVEASKHAKALGNLGMHGTIHIVEQVQSFADQFVTFLEVALLDLGLASRVEVVRITRLKRRVRLSRE